MAFLEIACFNEESASRAAESGADRIELCKEQSLGGTTPDLSTLIALRSTVSVPINVMIRPRSGDFIYSFVECSIMRSDIRSFAEAGAAGFVFGVLTDDHKIDLTLNAWLVSEAAGKPCTFHRAFDELEGEADEIELQLEVLIKCGFKAVLTSGGAPNAVEGRQRLARLVERANGRIDVIVGGGVRSDNVEVLRETGASWFHSSAIVDGGEVASGQEVRALKEKLDSWH